MTQEVAVGIGWLCDWLLWVSPPQWVCASRRACRFPTAPGNSLRAARGPHLLTPTTRFEKSWPNSTGPEMPAPNSKSYSPSNLHTSFPSPTHLPPTRPSRRPSNPTPVQARCCDTRCCDTRSYDTRCYATRCYDTGCYDSHCYETPMNVHRFHVCPSR
jgi:hypothetical protein